ncbi:fibronectin type III domain-containing protein [Cryomorphaceae bacterium 1068]|nr:fibronectin type III domain-containing protein [Cryomorphaceae bacterium 1068]
MFTRNVLKNMDGNANFPTPTPALADVTTKLDEFEDLALQAQFRDGRAILYRNKAGDELKDMLRTLGAYVSMVAEGDASIIVSAGFEVRSQSEPTPPLSDPTDLSATRSNRSGKVELDWETVKHALNYVVEMTTTDPVSPTAEWINAGTTSRSKFTVDNLEPGTYYWFRVKAFGRRDNSGYSDPAVVMAA